ncbi:hypothetical protein [Amycolatopsis keratiniphila]|uniref:Lantibiotic dehydratase n=1 Tax=Amycolatopsis keratiniphila subsp. keratiniphila TaxID=227715 RepID=A0A1W2LWS5_9PSEU|nr:hypothetical protein [Amycolatopsis keratiniphila]ONF71363.1 hypothetical protein AVR91_0211795 [Amycolatopsis keratiniphila subsp. keratiniphila]
MTTHQHSAVTMAPDTSAAFSPWTLARVGGLPTRTCALVGARTEKLLRRAEKLAEEQASIGASLAEVCYTLVPALDDTPALRRVALAVKRAAFRSATLPADADDLSDHLPPDARKLLAAYHRTTEETAESLRELASSVALDSARARATLVAQLDHEPFVRSLALAAPEWTRHGLSKAWEGELDNRNLRTLYSYVTRTAVKTSPYSRLTTVSMPGVAGTGSRSYSGAALAQLALRAAARDRELAPLLRYRVAAHTSTRPGGFVLLTEAEGQGPMSWSSPSTGHDAAAPAWLFQADNERDHTFAELRELMGGRDSWARYLRMLDSGWVHPVVCPPGTGDPLQGLTETLSAAEGHPMPVRLHRLHRSITRLADAALPERTATITAAKEAQAEWRAASGIRMWTPDLVYEDAATGFGVPEPVDAEPGGELSAYASELRPHLFRSHLYDFLLEAFVSRFGRGGRCTDVFGFLAALTVEDRASLPLSQAFSRDRSRADATRRADLPVGRTSAPPSVAVLFQEADTEAGRVPVVNQLCDGVGGMVSRFTGVLGDPLSDALVEWFSALWPGIARYELVNSRACTTAQYTAAGRLPALIVPGEGMPARPGDLPLERTTLIHDADRGVLELLGPDGGPFGLAYLGLIPPHLSSGLPRLLTVLANPWVAPHEFGDRQQAGLRPGEPELVARPRKTVGRTVVERANWLCHADRLPLPVKGEPESETVLRAHRWRREHGIPAEVFCRRIDDFTAKPLWADLRSAVSLAVLRQELTGSVPVRITEALPGLGQHRLCGPSGESLACEYVVGLRWPRPEARRAG